MRPLTLASAVLLVLSGCVSRPVPVTTGRGTSTGPARQAVIGPGGGTLASADGGVLLTVPAGALAADTTLTLEPITCQAPGCAGGAWRLGPDGTTFAAPATLRLRAPAEALAAASLGAQGLGFQDAQGRWHWVDAVSRDEAAGTVAVTTTHLSDWSPLIGVQLRPLTATVKEGQTLALEVKTCLTEDQDGLTTLLANCDSPLSTLHQVSEWSVDGQAGGSATRGTVQPTSNVDATFTAPATAPDPPTVAVTATLPAGEPRFARAILYSQVTIGSADTMTGSFTIVASTVFTPVPATVEARDVTLTLQDDGPDETNYAISGTAEMKLTSFQSGSTTCTLKAGEATKAIVHQGPFKIRKDPRLAVRWGYLEGFTYSCVTGGFTSETLVLVSFFTGTGQACAFADVPITDARDPSGTFASTCGVYGPATATWSFH